MVQNQTLPPACEEGGVQAAAHGLLDLPDDVLSATLLGTDGVSLLRLSLTSHTAAARLLALPHVWRVAARAALLPPPAANTQVIREQQAAAAAVAVASTLCVGGAGTDSRAEGAAEAAAATAAQAQAEAEAGAAGEAGAHRQVLLAHARFSAWCHSHSLRLTRLAAALPPAVGQGGGGGSRGGAGGGAGGGAAPPWAWQAPSAHDGAVLVPGGGRSLLCGGAEGGAGLAGAWKLSMADAFCLRVCSGSDIRVRYDEGEASCGADSDGRSIAGSRRGQLFVQCFGVHASPSGSPAKLCAVLLLQPDAADADGGGSSSSRGGPRPVAWVYFRSAPPPRAPWWWFQPLGAPIGRVCAEDRGAGISGDGSGGRCGKGDGGGGCDGVSGCLGVDREAVADVWLAGLGPRPCAAREAGRTTSGPSSTRQGNRSVQTRPHTSGSGSGNGPAGSRCVVPGGATAAAACVTTSAAVAAAAAEGLWRLVAAGRERWRCVAGLAIVSRQQLASGLAAGTGGGQAPAANSPAGSDSKKAACTTTTTGLGQLRALQSAGMVVLDLTAAGALALGGQQQHGRPAKPAEEETPEAASDRLRAAVAALPRDHPRLQVLLLPALLPRAPRAAVRTAPKRSGGSRTTAPRLLQLMVPVLSELRLAMAAPAWRPACGGPVGAGMQSPSSVPPPPPLRLHHLQHTLLVIGHETAGSATQEQGKEAGGGSGGGRGSGVTDSGKGDASLQAQSAMGSTATLEAVLRQLAASTLDRSTGSVQAAQEAAE